MTVKNKPKGLGRGLNAIFDLGDTALNDAATGTDAAVAEVAIDTIVPNEGQPRKQFAEEQIAELAESIKTLGLIQPITVRKEADDRFTIISGERRYRAAKMAGLEKVPVYIRDVDDALMLEMALVENIQRQDLNAVEIAISLQRLVTECKITQELLADRVGKKRSTVSNYIRLLKLPPEVQFALKKDLISMGHARALITVDSENTVLSVLSRIIKEGLSVRQTEDLIRNLGRKKTKESADNREYPEVYAQLAERLENVFDRQISISRNAQGKGRIVIGFESDRDIDEILSKLDHYTK